MSKTAVIRTTVCKFFAVRSAASRDSLQSGKFVKYSVIFFSGSRRHVCHGLKKVALRQFEVGWGTFLQAEVLKMMALKLLAALVCFLLTTSVFFWAANDAQRDVYMDEVFHVPQAQRYCDGNFTAVINAFSFVCFILISIHKLTSLQM